VALAVLVLLLAEARVLPLAAVLLRSPQGVAVPQDAAAAALVIWQAVGEVAAAVTVEAISRAAAKRPKRA